MLVPDVMLEKREIENRFQFQPKQNS